MAKRTTGSANKLPKYSCAFRVLSDVVMARTDISPSAKLVLMGLQYYGRNGTLCFPSNEAIGKRIGLSAATVKRALPELMTHGLIFVAKDDPRTPKGRRFDKLWMNDPKLHPLRTRVRNLEGQVDPIPIEDLEGQVALVPRGSSCTDLLEGHIDPLVNSLEGTLQRTAAAPLSEPPQPLPPLNPEGSGKRQLECDPVHLAPVIADVAKVYGTTVESMRSRVEGLARDYPLPWITRAAEDVAEVNKREAVGWGLLTKILRDYDDEGGPPPRRKAKESTDPRYCYFEEPPIYFPEPRVTQDQPPERVKHESEA